MRQISKIILHNFKRFKHIEIDVDPLMNILIGDNESGKSSILQAIDLVSRGSRNRIEEIGLERLFNVDVIREFLQGEKKLEDIPTMYIELYFPEQNEEFLNGINNSKGQTSDGIRLRCLPNHEDYSKQIKEILSKDNTTFPYEFFSIKFDTFAGNPYNGYSKQIKSIMIDNSQIGNSYSMNEYVRSFYYSRLNPQQRIETKHKYHVIKEKFKDEVLSEYTSDKSQYTLALKNNSDNNIETDITLLSNNVPIDNKGTGIQCFIKTELLLEKSSDDIDTLLLEEPECHLSYINMLKLIDLIKKSKNRQLFIATHSDLISTRIDLRKCILINSNSTIPIKLNDISEDTAKFFMKAPDNNMLQFVLSKKVILVEGDAEYILMDAFYKNVCNIDTSTAGVSVIAVDGRCFKRYLEIAKKLEIKVAIITDNDKDYSRNITNCYDGYMNDEYTNIKIFADNDNSRYTFEVCVYNDNKTICDEIIKVRELSVLDSMIRHKAESAFKLLEYRPTELVVPQYIKDAIIWIKNA